MLFSSCNFGGKWSGEFKIDWKKQSSVPIAPSYYFGTNTYKNINSGITSNRSECCLEVYAEVLTRKKQFE
jgi:hypothetical protein